MKYNVQVSEILSQPELVSHFVQVLAVQEIYKDFTKGTKKIIPGINIYIIIYALISLLLFELKTSPNLFP